MSVCNCPPPVGSKHASALDLRPVLCASLKGTAHAISRQSPWSVVPTRSAGRRSAHHRFGRFGRLFPQLKSLVADNDALKALANTMRDDAATSALTSDDQNIPAGYTYLGQFIDHDITLDITPLGAHENDPNAVIDFGPPRPATSTRFYGSGAQPRHRTSTTASIRTNWRSDDAGPGAAGDANVKAGLPNDLLRTREGMALTGDPSQRREPDHRADPPGPSSSSTTRSSIASPPRVACRRRRSFDTARQQVLWHYRVDRSEQPGSHRRFQRCSGRADQWPQILQIRNVQCLQRAVHAGRVQCRRLSVGPLDGARNIQPQPRLQ